MNLFKMFLLISLCTMTPPPAISDIDDADTTYTLPHVISISKETECEYYFTIPTSEINVKLMISRNEINKYCTLDRFFIDKDIIKDTDYPGITFGTTKVGKLFLCAICYEPDPDLCYPESDCPYLYCVKYSDVSEVPYRFKDYVSRKAPTNTDLRFAIDDVLQPSAFLNEYILLNPLFAGKGWDEADIMHINQDFNPEGFELWFDISALTPIKAQLVKYLEYRCNNRSTYAQEKTRRDSCLHFIVSRTQKPMFLPSNQHVFAVFSVSPLLYRFFLLPTQIPNSGALFSTRMPDALWTDTVAMALATLLQLNIESKAEAMAAVKVYLHDKIARILNKRSHFP